MPGDSGVLADRHVDVVESLYSMALAFLAAAPARPAATFLGSFDLAVGEAATGTGAGVVTLSNPSVYSVWVFTQALCAGVV